MPFRRYGATTPHRHAVQHPRPTTIYLSWLAVVQKRELQSSVQRTTTRSMPLFSCAQRFHQRYWWVFPCVIVLFTFFFLSGPITRRDGEQGLKPISTAAVSLSSATGSWQPLYTAWNQGQLTRAVLREYGTTQDVDRFLSSPVALTPALSMRSRVASACTMSSSFPLFTSSPTLDTQPAVTPSTYWLSGDALASGFASSSSSLFLSTGTSSGSRSRTKEPLDSGSPRVDTPDGHGAPFVGFSTSRERLCLFCDLPFFFLMFWVSFNRHGSLEPHLSIRMDLLLQV